MTVKLYDRLFETTTTIGTGAITLAGAAAGYRAFSTAGNGKKVFYEINDGDSNGLVTKWEVGIGTVNTGSNQLNRDTVISSSTGAAVNFGSGTKNVFGVVPASALFTRDEGLNFTDLMGLGGGTANAQTVTMPVTPKSYTDGMVFMYRPTVACTGAMTINVDGLGAKSSKMGGDDTVAGSVNIGDTLLCAYRLSTDTIEIINFTQEALPRTAAKTATFSVAVADRNKTFLVNATSAAVTANLLAAATAGAGFTFSVKKTDSSANAVTIDPNASETVDGALTLALTGQYDVVTIISDGANWNKMASNGLSAASTATTQAGMSTTQAVTPGGLKAAQGFSNFYESSELTYVAGFSAYSGTHGLSNPRFSHCILRNKTAEANFSVADEANLPNADNASTFSWISGHNATTVFAAGGPIRFGNKTTSTAPTTLTAANWRVVLKAWG